MTKIFIMCLRKQIAQRLFSIVVQYVPAMGACLSPLRVLQNVIMNRTSANHTTRGPRFPFIRHISVLIHLKIDFEFNSLIYEHTHSKSDN